MLLRLEADPLVSLILLQLFEWVQRLGVRQMLDQVLLLKITVIQVLSRVGLYCPQVYLAH